VLSTASGANVCSIPEVPAAAAQARWLAELAEALDQAQGLLKRLDLNREERASAVELFLRIEGALHEVGSLRLSRRPRSLSGPERIKSLPWNDGECSAR